MATADNGNFDLVFEMPDETLLTQVAGLAPTQAIPVFLTAGVFTGVLSMTPTLAGITTTAPSAILLRFVLAGSTGMLNTVTINGVTSQVPNWMRPVTLDGTADVQDRLAMAGLALVVNFSAATNGEPVVTVTLDEGTLFDNPAMQLALAQVILAEPDPADQQAAYEQLHATILAEITASITAQLTALIQLLGQVTLAPAPAALPMSAGAPVAATAAGFTLSAGQNSLHLCYDYTGAAGNTALLTRSMLLRDTATGTPLDALGLSVRNAFLLGTVIRRAAAAAPPTGLGLPAAGFVPGLPLFWIGNTIIPFPPATPPAITTLLTSIAVRRVVAGIDGTNLRLSARFQANGVWGSFTARTTVDQAFALTATVGAGNTLAITAAPAGAPVVTNSDADIAWWVYLAAAAMAAFTGGIAGALTATAVLGAIDLFGGTFANGPLAALLGPLVPGVTLPPAPLPPGMPPLSVRGGVNLTQPGSAARPPVMVTVAGLTIPIVEPFRAEDVLIRFT